MNKETRIFKSNDITGDNQLNLSSEAQKLMNVIILYILENKNKSSKINHLKVAFFQEKMNLDKNDDCVEIIMHSLQELAKPYILETKNMEDKIYKIESIALLSNDYYIGKNENSSNPMEWSVGIELSPIFAKFIEDIKKRNLID